MPVPRVREREEQVEYVVVRRTGLDGEDDADAFDTIPTATETVAQLLEPSNVRREAQPATTSDDSDDDDDDFEHHGPPPVPILITMTLPQAQATGGALAAEGPTETVVVTFSPPPKPEGGRGRGGISQTTEHLLIAAGSIGATIIIVMILLAIHTMRKRGLTLAEAVKQGKYQVTRRGPPPPPPKSRAAAWDSKPAPAYNEYKTIRNETITPPPAAASLARSGSSSSQRPLMALNRSESFNRPAITERSISPGTVPQSFLLDSPPRRNNSNNSHKRSISATPSSPVLPLQNPRRSASTRNTRSISESSELQYPEAVPEPQEPQQLSPLRPPPTFKQFLFNRPSVSGRPGPPGVSRFSWTNSNAPQTPHDLARDTGSHMIGRDSFMTQRSSVPRFRTVDSWVDQQTNRLEAQKLQDQFRNTQMSTVSAASAEEERDTVPEVPMLPKSVMGLREAGVKIPIPSSPSPQRNGSLRNNGLPGKNIKHERHETTTTVDTAPIFRQHPGTEVRFSTRSAVPSEILDMGRKPNVLS